jgi:hypothetical protein
MEKSLLWTIAALALISVILSCVAIFNQPSVPTASDVAKLVVIPAITAVEYNDTAIKTDVAKVQATLDEDDLWEADAQKLAEAEYTNRHLYNALLDLNVTDLDDKDDITKFVIKDTDISGADADDKDADVEQEVRIYYENSVGDDVRITLIITTEILDGDVEQTDYALA